MGDGRLEVLPASRPPPPIGPQNLGCSGMSITGTVLDVNKKRPGGSGNYRGASLPKEKEWARDCLPLLPERQECSGYCYTLSSCSSKIRYEQTSAALRCESTIDTLPATLENSLR